MTHNKTMRWKVRKQLDGMWAIFDPNGQWVAADVSWPMAIHHASGDFARRWNMYWRDFERWR